jgi:delta
MIFFSIPQIQCSGLFELKLRSFRNDKGKDNIGTCCSGVSDASGRCIGSCKTRFRVCLKHYQAKIDLKSPCTFGDVITPVLGENTFNLSLSDLPTINGFINSVRFPFDFAWPVSSLHIKLN